MSAIVGGIAGGLGLVGGIGGALISSNAEQNAAQTQAQAEEQAAQLQYQEFQQEQTNEAPWLAAGSQALSQMQNPSFQQPFTMADFQQDPGYQFNMQQGISALQNSAAARGGLMSGNTGQALANYSQGLAGNQYEQAYQNYNNNQSLAFNRLASIAGMGQTAVGQEGQAGQAYAGNVGSLVTGNANAQAASQIAQGQTWGNAVSGGLGGIGQNWMQASLLNRFAPQSPGGAPNSSAGTWQTGFTPTTNYVNGGDPTLGFDG